ncbi:MAG: hypothetical protein UT36_C0006G0016 [Candidatus Peregrinibacteria bacterium GW2011_GWF2_39_17]|nr:MAG: hypothetical protein UT36_C0006G0016 [Candidatus Peregrinibacteria bacterium GW2011_GWF2_39_17]
MNENSALAGNSIILKNNLWKKITYAPLIDLTP